MNHAEKARDLFREGYNCAQSVVGAFHEEMGLSLSEATRLASSFGGGMGGLRETCGAVTGMFLVAGMLMGYDDPADYDGKKAHYARIRQLAEQFRQKHSCEASVSCRSLNFASSPCSSCCFFFQSSSCIFNERTMFNRAFCSASN